MTISYSDLILQALTKHGRLNTRQLAAKISYDTKKTTQLVSYMRTSKKLKTDGEIDGLAAYSLTDAERSLVAAELPRADRSPATPSSLDDLADTQLRPGKYLAAESPPPGKPRRAITSKQVDKLLEEVRTDPAFGLLNTGEFVIMAKGYTIIIAAKYVPAMRAQLNTPAAGASQ